MIRGAEYGIKTAAAETIADVAGGTGPIKAIVKKAVTEVVKRKAKKKLLKEAIEKETKKLDEWDEIHGGYYGQHGAKPKNDVIQDRANWSAIENGPINIHEKFKIPRM